MIPSYEEIMLPLLKMLSDGQEHSLQEADDYLSAQFKLIETERRELLPSGQQPVFRNRLGWARTYLKKAGLLSTPKRAHFKITERGVELLKEKPTKITLDNPEHTHPLSGKKAIISSCTFAKKGTNCKMASRKQGKKGRVRPFSGAYAPREPLGCKNTWYSGAYPPIFSI